MVSTANTLEEQWTEPPRELWCWEEMLTWFGAGKKHSGSSRIYCPRKAGVRGYKNMGHLSYSLELIQHPVWFTIVCILMPSSGMKKVLPHSNPHFYKKLPRWSSQEGSGKIVHPLRPTLWLRGFSGLVFFFPADTPFNFFLFSNPKTFKTTSAAKLCPYGETYAPRPEHGKRAPCNYSAHWDVHTQLHTFLREEGFRDPKGCVNKIWNPLLINTIQKYKYKRRYRALEGLSRQLQRE